MRQLTIVVYRMEAMVLLSSAYGFTSFPHGMLTTTDRLTQAQDREQDHRQN